MTGLAEAVRDRLEAVCGTGPAAPLHGVGLAADALIARAQLRRPVEAWVLGYELRARPPATATGPVRQLATESVLVLTGYLYSGAVGTGVDPEPVEEAIVAALLGWTAPGRASPLVLREARLASFDAGAQTLFRQTVFECQRHVRAV